MEVKAGSPELQDVNLDQPTLVDIRIPLEPTPNDAWVELFCGRPDGYGHPASMLEPRFIVDTIEVTAPPDEVGQYMERIMERVHLTNVQYERDVAPEVDRRREAKAAEAARRQKMLDTARERLAPWTS